MRCPGQDFKWYEDLLFALLFGIVFLIMGMVCSIFIFNATEDMLFSFFYFPLIVYFVGSGMLFILTRLSP